MPLVLLVPTPTSLSPTNAGEKEVDFGFVGDVKSEQLPVSTWQQLLEIGLTPVVAPLTHDGKGSILNTNADTMTQEIAKALGKVYSVSLIYSFEKPGVLLDVNDDNSVINKLNPTSYQELKSEQKIFAGMIPKLDNAFSAFNAGVTKVIIGGCRKTGPINCRQLRHNYYP